MFTITIETGNAAFEYAEYELARILRKYADEIENGSHINRPLFDINGNKVGAAAWDDSENN